MSLKVCCIIDMHSQYVEVWKLLRVYAWAQIQMEYFCYLLSFSNFKASLKWNDNCSVLLYFFSQISLGDTKLLI